MSEDLLIADAFSYAVDKRNRKVTFKALYGPANGSSVQVWKSNKRNRIGYVNMAKILRQFGLAWEDLLGTTYKVKRRGTSLEVQL